MSAVQPDRVCPRCQRAHPRPAAALCPQCMLEMSQTNCAAQLGVVTSEIVRPDYQPSAELVAMLSERADLRSALEQCARAKLQPGDRLVFKLHIKFARQPKRSPKA